MSEKLAKLIREQSDDDLLAMVLDREPAKLVTKPVISRPRSASKNGNDDIELVHKTIKKKQSGTTVRELKELVGLPRAAVVRAIAALKESGKVFQGGERRFARYATSKQAADKASKLARNGKRR